MIIKDILDNDLYKFTMMNAVQKLYPKAEVKYTFFDRRGELYPQGFADALKHEINTMSALSLTAEGEQFLTEKCYYFDPVFIDFLKGFRYNPNEVAVQQIGNSLSVEVVGPWYRTVLWEVPLMAMISELFFRMQSAVPQEVETKAETKGEVLAHMKAVFSEFGTRRRFSFDVQNRVLKCLVATSGKYLSGSSNVYMAMKYGLKPIGTHPHEWFMFHASQFGYRLANKLALDNWVAVYHGDLGIALTDTYTTDVFFKNFSKMHAKLFDGLRHDSGDPLLFADKAIEYYKSQNISPQSKTIVFSDSLNVKTVEAIKTHTAGRINDAYGIGTFLTNDVGVRPLNIVIKMTEARLDQTKPFHPTVKLSDVEGKHTGSNKEIELCLKALGIEKAQS